MVLINPIDLDQNGMIYVDIKVTVRRI